MRHTDQNKWKEELFTIHARYSHQSEDQIRWRTETVQCLSKDGRIIHFTKPADISSRMDILLSWLLDKELEVNGDQGKLVDLLARLWISFISIHPFLDHNGKTAIAFLDAVARNHQFKIADPSKLTQLLLTGKSQLDLQAVATIMIAILRRKHYEEATDWIDGFLGSSKSS